jgi:DNA-binding response OmpR family regulator
MTISGVSVVVVDDDAEIRDLVRAYLSDEGFSVGEAADGGSMRNLIAERVPDLVLLDLRLPGEDGLTLARELRQNFPRMGIVMISGKEDVVDRVAGLEVGADDYVVKPFHLRELLARVRSVLRRRENGQSVEANQSNGVAGAGPLPRKICRFSDWVLDCDGRTLSSIDGKAVELTSREFDLLVAFAAHPNRALTRNQLLDYASCGEGDAYDRSIDVQVGRLRRKIERDTKRPALIKTIRNVGYMFTADVTVSKGGLDVTPSLHRSKNL